MRVIRLVAIACLFVCVLALQPLTAAAAGPSLSSVSLGTVPRGVAVNSNTGSVYAVLYLNGTTLALNPQTLSTVAKIPTPSPYAVAVDPETGTVYVSQGQGDSVTVIDGSSNSIVQRINGTGTPYALAVDDSDHLLFCADTSEESLWIVNASNDVVSAHIPIGSTSALAVDPAAHEAFAGNLSSDMQSGDIEVVNTTTMSLVRTVPIPIPPGHFAVDPASHILFVSSAGGTGSGTNFLAIDDQTFQTIYSMHLGGSPNIIAVGSSPDVYVSDQGLNRLYELVGTNGTVLYNSTGNSDGISFTGITSMAFDSQMGRLYITENDVTSLIILATSSSSTTSTSSTTSATSVNSTTSGTSGSLLYLLLAGPAVASAAAGLLGILYLRRRRGKRHEGAQAGPVG
jgi:DNA-binding beta-propeller fold protein YncE